MIEQNQPLSTSDGISDKTDILFCKSLQSAGSVKPSPTFQKIFRKRIPLPVRTYYHDVTFDPISLTEWLCGNMIARDYVNEYEWRRIVDTSVSFKGRFSDFQTITSCLFHFAVVLQALYDLMDVTIKEKLFMTLWNDYMRNHPIIAAALLPSQVKSFVQMHSSLILDDQLEDEFIKHLINMWVEGQIGRDDILVNIKIYNSLVEGKKRFCSNKHRP